MNEPQLVTIQSASPAVERIKQSVYHPANHEKISLLLGLIQKLEPERSIIFTNTKHATIKIWEYLQGNGINAAVISGDIQQSKRESLLKKFHDGEFSILVATDVASRGLHIPDVTHIFNYDLPDQGEDYVHRIGRTARAGNSGHAISFACEDFAMNLMDIEAYTKRPIPTLAITSDLLVKPLPPMRMKNAKPAHRTSDQKNRSGNRSRPRGKAGSSAKNRPQQQSS